MPLSDAKEWPLETAYYYPEPYWYGAEAGWLKSLLLFFDGVAILLPDYMYGRHTDADPSLSGPLEDRGLLTILRPETFVDQQVTEALADAMVDLLTAGAFDALPAEGYFAELSRSRMGWNADVELSDMLVDELKSRGLARDTEDGVSIPLHPQVRTTILILLSQLARAAGRKHGLRLHPTTADPERIADLMSTLSLAEMPTAGRVVSLDLETVTLNLEHVSLDDVLDFREEHREAHHSYVRSVRSAVLELSNMPLEERSVALGDRRDELADQADALRRLARKRWRMPLARFGLGVAGATVSAAAGSLPAALVAVLGGVLGAKPERPALSAYSYLFAADRVLSRHGD
jgi:hypothetical protein